MKKYSILILVFILSFLLVGCDKKKDEGLVLKIYNWQDYIDEGLDDDGMKVSTSVMEDWQAWYKKTYGQDVKVVYHTFETNEVMLNNIKTGKDSYDLICPSEYTIQRMLRLAKEDKNFKYELEPFDYDMVDQNGNKVMSNYQYISPYLMDLFESKGWKDYAVPYMWGTMGFLYNPAKVKSEKIKHWDILWDKDYKNFASAKDSVRDTYVVGVMHYYYDELMELRENYQNGKISPEDYTKKLGAIMNRCDDNTLNAVEKELKEMKKNLYGFEVDSGKSDIVTGKVSINFAWSGDAVYSLDVAEEEYGVKLNYEVPEEGSNVWFDGWIMPKLKGTEISKEKKQLAQSFVNFVCNPEIAARNMNFIGYTSSIVGDEILDLIDEWYGPTLPEFDKTKNTWTYGVDDEGNPLVDLGIKDKNLQVSVKNNDIYLGDQKVKSILENIKDEDGNPYSDSFLCTSYEADLSYLFGDSVSPDRKTDGKVVVTVKERGRQFDTQYPSEEVIRRCGIMEDFGKQNEAVMAMWENVKIGDIHIGYTIGLIVVVVGLVAFININKYMKNRRRKQRKNDL